MGTPPPEHGLRLDPYDPDFQQSPFPTYARLRREAPVFPVPGHGWYAVTRMDLVRAALRDPVTYANSGVAGRRSEPPPEVADEVAALRARGHPYRPALGLSDPPAHTRYRRLVNRAFTPRALAWMEPLVESAARELAAGLPDGQVVDVVAAVTRPLPVWAILRILGLSDDRRADVARWSDAATASLGARLDAQRWLEVERDVLDFQLAMAAELDQRRARPREDLLSTLVAPVEDGEPLGNGELVWLVRELLVAGNETTARTLAEILLRLGGDPGTWQRIRRDPAWVARVVEEGLRLSSPAMGMFRRVTRDTELGGVRLPEGATVFLVYGSANRDESVFPDADSFDADRANAREHVAFGHGLHVCVGAGLARLEAAAALRALADHVDELSVVDPAALAYLPSFFLRGLTSLPVTVRRRAATAAPPAAGPAT
ncbi:cytochrome P450 [Trujillonella humicola]|uniref:cytochrome P450 n=1 Tax=Trujillonella humicola TaxID=3383699 RepID=UPI003905D255